MNKKWVQVSEYNREFEEQFREINGIVLQLLYNRGLNTQDKIDQFLGPDYVRDQHDPFLFNDMKIAVDRVFKAIRGDEKIVIHGDYDADGVCATAVMFLTLKRLGAKNLDIYIPDRMKEGYGLNEKTIEYLAEKKTDLMITVDCGISAYEEVKLAGEKGIDVIITDHHMEPEKLPRALAVICPTLKQEKYLFKKLAGVGVAFKLAQALLRSEGKNNNAFEKWLLDIVAIGTVADCMPLLGENRTLVKWGLLVLNKTQRLGLKELIKAASWSKEIDARTIGFQIAPRLNAAGRMDHANTAYELLITEDEVEALAISSDLNQKNQNRQSVTEEMMKISLDQIKEPGDDKKILFSCYDGWSPGLVGLAAGRLADKFSRPVIVFGQMGDKYVASGRSIPEFDITGALGECKEFLEEFGGHEQACGLTIMGDNNYNEFKKKISEIAGEKLKDIELIPSLEIEAEIRLSEVNWELVDELEKFGPFGEGNQEPIFLTRGLVAEEISTMGSTNKHLKMDLNGKKFVGFGLAEKFFGNIKIGNKVDVAYKLGVNEWNGNREIQCQIVDLKLCIKN